VTRILGPITRASKPASAIPRVIVRDDGSHQLASRLGQIIERQLQLVRQLAYTFRGASVSPALQTCNLRQQPCDSLIARDQYARQCRSGGYEIAKYIHYYNNERIKLRLNGLSPIDYRMKAATA